jgi:hypothetical protein
LKDIAKPQQLSGQVGQLTVTVNAIALSRAEWHSGWDMMKKKPKVCTAFGSGGDGILCLFLSQEVMNR